MSEFDDIVERQRLILKAEEWATQPASIHIHRLKSMWYETKESLKDTDSGNVTDTVYNDGFIERKQEGKVIRTFGEKLFGDDLIDKMLKHT